MKMRLTEYLLNYFTNDHYLLRVVCAPLAALMRHIHSPVGLLCWSCHHQIRSLVSHHGAGGLSHSSSVLH